MTRSNIIRIIFAAFCGLAAQFHGSSANAQNVELFQGTVWNLGDTACTQNHYCLSLWGGYGNVYQGTLQLFDPNGNRLWMSPGDCGFWCEEILIFQKDGNLVVYDQLFGLVNWATNT